MLLHKSKIYAAIAALALPLCMASCINDAIDEPGDTELIGNDTSEELQEGNYVVGFDIRFPEAYALGTEGEYEDGSHTEHQVKERGIYACFFDAENKLVNLVEMTAAHYDKDADNQDIEYTIDNQVEGRYYATYKVKRNKIKPASCLVVLNGSNSLNNQLIAIAGRNGTIDEVLSLIWEDTDDPRNIGHDGSYQYFTMSNSVYINEDGELTCAVPLNTNSETGHFVPEEDLVDAGVDPYATWDGTQFEGRILIIPVERMLAKFSFYVDATKNNYDSDNLVFTPQDNGIEVFKGIDSNGNIELDTENYFYKVKLVSWGVNALETQNYLTKNISGTSDYFQGWNDADHSRSYWSEDPHYEVSGLYPLQYRKAIDNTNLVYYQAKEDSKGNLLHNYSYNELNNEFSKILYAPENTYAYDIAEGYKAWNQYYQPSRLHKLVGSHLLLCTELQTNIVNQGTYSAGDVYRDRNGVFYKNELEYFKAMVQTLHNDFSSQSEIQFTYYNWGDPQTYPAGQMETIIINTGKKWVESDDPYATEHTSSGEWYLYYQDASGNDVRITMDNVEQAYNYLKSITTEANVTNGDGKVLLWYDHLSIKDSDKNPLQRCTLGQEKRNADGSTYWRYINSRGITIKQNVGPLDDNHRKSLIYEWLGAADHFKDGKMYYAAPVENVKLGGENQNFGVLRNTFYKFTLNNVNTIGTSVDNPAEAIVPNAVLTNNQLTFEVDFIGWHTIDIDLPSKF